MEKVEDKQGKQTRYRIANKRVEAALLRLEKVMDKPLINNNAAELEEISALILENKKLKKINKSVEERLSRAIKKLKNILKEA